MQQETLAAGAHSISEVLPRYFHSSMRSQLKQFAVWPEHSNTVAVYLISMICNAPLE